MTTEFTAWCNQYYQLTRLFSERCERFKNLLDNAPPYGRQNSLSDIDNMISYDRKIQAAKAKGDKTFKELTETRRTILAIMRYFKISPRTILIGQIAGELEYEIWANEKDDLFIGKIRDLPQEALDPNIIVIKCWDSDKGDEDD
ncbi:hypothetical protein [Mucilaginibacter sp. OK098]|uniref:hypothetical protein n=1 Tax=Mucilaginibacter sp. OK098 TaxID=1855297 RepID=UPI00091DAF02|nr:hypothetical protein [Mucilaginibacter sp. OK098]SHM20518.1 hypothetical protein SAMN05216524_1011150 [Mucilaginibacter sp. OK098]